MATINLEVKAEVDEAEKALEKLSKKLNKDASGALNTFGVNLAALDNPLTLVAQGLKASIDFTTQWGDTIDDLSRVTGESAEETSRLAIVLGDMGVSTDSLRGAAKALKDQGLTPNLETLKKLAAQYQAIQDPAKRTEWGTKTLGRAYFELSEVLTKTPEQFDSLSAAASRSGKVMSGEAVQAAEDYGIRLRQMGDQVDGLKLLIGGPLIVALSEAATALQNEAGIVMALAIKFQLATGQIDQNTAALKAQALVGGDVFAAFHDVIPVLETAATAEVALASAVDVAAGAADAQGWAMWAAAEKTRALDQAARDLKQAESDLATILAGPVAQELDAYQERQRDAGAAIADTKEKIDGLNSKKYLTVEQKLELAELTQTLKDQQQTYADNATAHEEATARIVFGFIQQRLASDSLQDGEIATLAAIGQAWGIYDEKTAATLAAVDAAITEHGSNATAIIDALGNSITALPDKKDFYYNIFVTGQIPDAGVADTPAPVSVPPGGGGIYGGAQAAGGDYMVTRPTWFLAGERGPERATFTPQGAGGGGGDTIILNINNPAAAALAMAMVRDRQRSRLNSFMGG